MLNVCVENVLIQERNLSEKLVANDITIEKTIQKMKNGTAPEHNEITVEMIKTLSQSGLKELLKLLNNVRAKKMTTKDWQIGIICPIYKKGESQQCTSYRGIILGSKTAKMYARILEGRLRNEVEHILEETQYGFKKERRTQDQIFILRQVIETSLKQVGKYICASSI